MGTQTTAGRRPDGVAAKATIKGAMALKEMTVIGVFGPEKALQALIRMPDGQIQKVSRGTRLGSGLVTGIDATGLILARGSDTRRLTLPGG